MFYIVFCPSSDKPVTKTFTNLKQAVRVAEKMRLQYPDSKFHVMGVVDEIDCSEGNDSGH